MAVELWKQVEKWVRQKISPNVKFSDLPQIFGQQSGEPIINTVTMNTKMVIYNNQKIGKNITLLR